MNEFGIILKLSVAITFIFAGFSKFINIKESSGFARDLGIFPAKLGAILGFCMPIIELIIGIGMIFYKNIYIDILAIGVIMFFIGLNLNAIVTKKTFECFCYGKIIKTQLGLGGIIHYLYILCSILISLFILTTKIEYIFTTHTMLNQVIMLSIVALIFVNGIVIQVVLDKLK